MRAGGVNEAIRYEADDSCPPLVTLSVGIQGVMLAVAPLVLVVAITSKAGGQDDSYLSWAVFAALIIAGVLTALQATRIGRLGAGHILIMGATPNFVAVSVLALEGGGPSLLASLIVVRKLVDDNLEIEGRTPGSPLDLDRSLSDAGVSSPDIVAFWKVVNEEFGVDISAEQFAEMLTPRDLVAHLDAA